MPGLDSLTSLTGGGGLSTKDELMGGGTGSTGVVIAPVALNLGAILQNLQGPPENGGSGVTRPASGFGVNALSAGGAAIGQTVGSVSNVAMFAVLGVVAVGGLFLIKRRK